MHFFPTDAWDFIVLFRLEGGGLVSAYRRETGKLRADGVGL